MMKLVVLGKTWCAPIGWLEFLVCFLSCFSRFTATNIAKASKHHKSWQNTDIKAESKISLLLRLPNNPAFSRKMCCFDK